MPPSALTARLPLARLARLLCALVAATGLHGQEPTSEMIPTGLREGGLPVELEMVVYRPPGPGPFPTVVFNHGSTGTGSDPAEFTKTWHSATIAAFFRDRGWMTVFPQRRGRGRSGGLYDEGFTPGRTGYTCDPPRSLAGLERALTDLDHVVAHLRTRPDVDASRLLAAGQSRGGILAIAHAGTRPGLYRGAVNFVGGWMSDACPDPAAINTVTFVRGAAFTGPTLWLYGERDSFYGLPHSRSNFEAFTAAGGSGAFHVLDRGPGLNGHFLYHQSELWGPLAETFLRGLAGPSAGPLLNLSVRARAAAAPAILGFVVGGTGTRPVVLRGLGPALGPFGVAGWAGAPTLRLLDAAGTPLAEAGAWGGAADLAKAFAEVGAFALDPGAADAATRVLLATGPHTLHVADAGGSGTVLLGEVFAAPSTDAGTAGLVNLAARVEIGQGEATAIAGFVLGGTTPSRVLLRAAGPALAAFGVADAVADPTLAVFDATGALLAGNEDWQAPATAAAVAAATTAAGAFPFPPGSRDAAVLLDLPPGPYTLHGTSSTPGTVLLEVYAVP